MTEAELKIRLTLEGAGQIDKESDRMKRFTAVLRDTELAYKRGALSQKTALGVTAELWRETNKLNLSYENLVKAQTSTWYANNRMAIGFKSMASEVVKANGALRSAGMVSVNFSRVMQDMPFGLIAIQNNIEPLISSLGQMKTEAAAAGISFKTAMLNAAFSVGGMVGAVTMVLPLISRLIDYFGKLE
jgi:hypothetical protein